MDESYSIRAATPDDVPQLPRIEQLASELFADTDFADEAAQECLSVEFLSEQLEAGRLWVAVDEYDRPVGFAAAILMDGSAHLHEVSVDPTHGKRGIGRKLVETVCEWARSEGHPSVTLSTFRDIPWNAPFYEQLGFSILDNADLGDGLVKLRKEEAGSGLNVNARVIMKRLL